MNSSKTQLRKKERFEAVLGRFDESVKENRGKATTFLQVSCEEANVGEGLPLAESNKTCKEKR